MWLMVIVLRFAMLEGINAKKQICKPTMRYLRTLSLDIICGWYFFCCKLRTVRFCLRFNASMSMDAFITMATYTASRREWLKFFDASVGIVDPLKYAPGMAYNQDLSAYKYGYRNMEYMLHKGVNKVVVWNNPPPNQGYWDVLGYFLNAARTPCGQFMDNVLLIDSHDQAL